MSAKWSDIMFVPDEDVAAATADAWSWLISDPWKMVLCSMFGGVFFERDTGGVFWLECPTAQIVQVAGSAAEFHAFLGGPRDDKWANQVEEWFLIDFVGRLHDAGKIPKPGQCYGLTILPVFEGGKYIVDNVFVLSAREWLTATASMHDQLRAIPDGAQVKIKIVD